MLILLTFVVASFYDYPSTILDHDPDLKYWVYKNKVKKLTCSPMKYWGRFDSNYSTEYSFSESGELIEERYYIEYIGDFSVEDTVALTNDGHVFYDTLGISHKRYFLKGDIIRKIQLNDSSGNLVFCFLKDYEDDFDFYRAKILVKSIKYIDGKRDIEIMDFGFMINYTPYFDTISSVRFANHEKINLVSVTAWVKDPRELDWYEKESRREYYAEQKRVDTIRFDLKSEPRIEKLIAAFGSNSDDIFDFVEITNVVDYYGGLFSRVHEYYDNIEHGMYHPFNEYRRYLSINTDSTVAYSYHLQIEVISQNEIGKLKRTYYLYGPISENPPELNGYFQYDKNGNLIEAYSLNCIGWNKTSYEYDGELIKKMTVYKEHMDSMVYRCERKKILVMLPYGQSFYDDIIEFYSDTDYPPSLIYDTIKSEDYSLKSRISFVGESRDTITNFIVTDSSNRIYTVEYW